MRIINFEKGDYYELPSTPKKNKKNKYAQRISALEAALHQARGVQWYIGAGDPDTVPRSEWAPDAEVHPIQPGDIYMNSKTGDYGVFAPTDGEKWNIGKEKLRAAQRQQ